MTSLVLINGQTYDATALTPPPEGRVFRSAWNAVTSGVVQVDLDKAKVLRLEQLMAEAAEDAKLADKEAALAEMKGRPQDATAARARANRRNAQPNVNAIRNASDVATLATLTIDDIT